MDVKRSIAKVFDFKHTLMRACKVPTCISLAALKKLITFDVVIKAILVQLYRTSFEWTLILLLKNSFDKEGGGEKKLLTNELSSNTLVTLN